MEIGQFARFDSEDNIEAIGLTSYPCSVGLVQMIAKFMIDSQKTIKHPLHIYFEKPEHSDAWRYTQQIATDDYYTSDMQKIISDIFKFITADHSTTDHSFKEKTASTSSSDGDKDHFEETHHIDPAHPLL